jgi:hypothetical protein
MCAGTARWDRSGSDPLPLRWVRTREPEGKRPPTAILSPDPTQTAEPIVRDVRNLWNRDVSVEQGRAHFGIETPRPWPGLTMERSTPLLCGLSPLVTLFGQGLHPDGQVPGPWSARDRKPTAPVREVLAVVRPQFWGQRTFPTAPTDPDVVFVPGSTRERLSFAVCSCVRKGQSQAQVCCDSLPDNARPGASGRQ